MGRSRSESRSHVEDLNMSDERLKIRRLIVSISDGSSSRRVAAAVTGLRGLVGLTGDAEGKHLEVE